LAPASKEPLFSFHLKGPLTYISDMIGAFQKLALLTVAALAQDCSLGEEGSRCAAKFVDEDELPDQDVQSAVQLSARASSKTTSFESYMAEYGRTYAADSEEYEMRRGLFHRRSQEILQHNSNTQRRWSAALNRMTDRTEAELSQLRGLIAMKAPGNTGAQHGQFLDQIANTIIPEEKSWTHLQATKADTDQSSCGSCWAVATATVLRANSEISGRKRTFSPQELVDCVPNPHHCGGEGGCKGSTVELALNWVMEKGLETLADTPYEAADRTCKKNDVALLSDDGHHDGDVNGAGKLAAMIAEGFHGAKSHTSAGLALGLNGWTRLPENEYEPLVRAIATTGPVAVSVAAHDWHKYSEGIFDGCGRDAVIDHAVTLVGYGKSHKTADKYWIVKNSWGLSWGEEGNIRLLRHEGNAHCGTDHKPKVGTACDNGPSEVKVCGMCGILYDSVVPHFDKL